MLHNVDETPVIEIMAKLQLFGPADDILTRVQNRNVLREGNKMLVYGLLDITSNEDIESLCHAATETFQLNAAADGYQNSAFVTPAPSNCRQPGRGVQKVLDAHVSSLEHFVSDNDNHQQKNNSIFPFAFVVV
jgi:hypothetical protein